MIKSACSNFFWNDEEQDSRINPGASEPVSITFAHSVMPTILASSKVASFTMGPPLTTTVTFDVGNCLSKT